MRKHLFENVYMVSFFSVHKQQFEKRVLFSILNDHASEPIH